MLVSQLCGSLDQSGVVSKEILDSWREKKYDCTERRSNPIRSSFGTMSPMGLGAH